MSKTGNLWLAALGLAGLLLTGCDNKPTSYSHAGGVVDGWPVWGHGPQGQRYSANTQSRPAM